MENPLDLTGRRILITGASSGIGRETAVLFSELNARVVLGGRDAARLEATRARLRGEGHTVAPFDLEALNEIPRWIKGITAEGGALDGIVHSAGVHMLIPLAAASAARVESFLKVNAGTAIVLAKAFRQKGCWHPGGSLVFISSVMGLAGEPGTALYAASKAALLGITRSLAMELAPDGVRVNAIAPGMVETEMSARLIEAGGPQYRGAVEAQHPLGLGRARDVAYGAAYLMAETGRWITGTTLVIDGGFTAH